MPVYTIVTFVTLWIVSGYAQNECGQSQYPDSGRVPESVRNSQERIVNGWEVRKGEYPFQALLLYFQSPFCGGFLIDQNTVVTAAHCPEGYPAVTFQVVLGEHYRDDPTDGVAYNVSEVIMHPNYIPAYIQNDIALMILAKPAEFNEFVQPICLPEQDALFAGQMAIVTGWGTTGEGGGMTNELRAADLPIISDQECRQCLPGITDAMVCGGTCGVNEKDTCQGDSGGPMAVKECAPEGCDNGGTWIVVGITSWGYGCASEYPGAYAEVSHFTDWINDNKPPL